MKERTKKTRTSSGRATRLKRQLPLHLMLLPGILAIFIFHYIPLSGLVIAFEDFKPAKGFFGEQEWVGLENFRYLFSLPNFPNVIWNTFVIAFWKAVLSLILPVVVALLLNEVTSSKFKRTIQTAVYFPHFISWVILSSIMLNILSPSTGIVNRVLGVFGVEPIYFLGDNRYFRWTMILSSIWKEFGYGTVVYMASLTSIDPGLYDAAKIDGANRLQQMWHITLTGLRPLIVLQMVLRMDDLLNAGFDQIYNMYNTAVYATGDILDTLIYRLGLGSAMYGPAAAAGLFKSLISMVLISAAYYIAYKFFDYKLF